MTPNIPTLKAIVVGGEKGYVPVYSNAMPKGNVVGRAENSITSVLMPDFENLNPALVRIYKDNNYVQIWGLNGNLLYPSDTEENWIELPHLKSAEEVDEPLVWEVTEIVLPGGMRIVLPPGVELHVK